MAGVGLQLNCIPDEVQDVVMCDVVHPKVDVDLLGQLPAIKITAVTTAIDIIMVSKKIVHNLEEEENAHETHTQACMHARTDARIHTRMHAHTHTRLVY